MFVYELSGCGFESRCCHINFRCCACFEEGVPWYSDNYRMQIHSETRTWHDNNIQLSEKYFGIRYHFSTNEYKETKP